jgi:hypothetical protein
MIGSKSITPFVATQKFQKPIMRDRFGKKQNAPPPVMLNHFLPETNSSSKGDPRILSGFDGPCRNGSGLHSFASDKPGCLDPASFSKLPKVAQSCSEVVCLVRPRTDRIGDNYSEEHIAS